MSSLSLNSGTIDLAFTSTKPSFSDRQKVVYKVKTPAAGNTPEKESLVSYTLPYLFQSIDTTTGPKFLSVCEPILVSALQYTDIGGTLGTHPHLPPFPLCRSKTTAATTQGPQGQQQSMSLNPAQAAEGYSNAQGPLVAADWVTKGWVGVITVPATLVKTVSSGSLCAPPPSPPFPPSLQCRARSLIFLFKFYQQHLRIVTVCTLQVRRPLHRHPGRRQCVAQGQGPLPAHTACSHLPFAPHVLPSIPHRP